MARTIGNTIADSLDQGIRYSELLLAGVNADQFARFAAPGGSPVVSNHPAWIYGHLALYGPKILKGVGVDPKLAGVPDSFEAVCAKGTACEDDPESKIYAPMEEILAAFRQSYHVASEALRAASDEPFAAENSVGGDFTARFPTVGSAVTFYAGGHTMLHLGQMSAWRRMAGLGAA